MIRFQLLGTEDEGGLGDVMAIPPGHDSWVIGDDPLVYVDFEADPRPGVRCQ